MNLAELIRQTTAPDVCFLESRGNVRGLVALLTTKDYRQGMRPPMLWEGSETLRSRHSISVQAWAALPNG